MLKLCGSPMRSQPASSNPGACAPSLLPSLKCQPALKFARTRPDCAASASRAVWAIAWGEEKHPTAKDNDSKIARMTRGALKVIFSRFRLQGPTEILAPSDQMFAVDAQRHAIVMAQAGGHRDMQPIGGVTESELPGRSHGFDSLYGSNAGQGLDPDFALRLAHGDGVERIALGGEAV